ncbi:MULTISPECIES: DUF916 and DUF3324 domain-containing protein [Bacillus cereus group]|uniref:DUF916 and DUF3324 domain-containing protein n=1 Tax=Bacillus cereus group TaxID=86661 RepID=UPI0008FE90AF|nr:MULTISPECIES: DUF916 and DUF3324 domain-containing protein [Bacillus cereus group]MDG1619323.1 DUF916 and DUF3324 domain-containing protein [Bacillus mobilis]MDX5841109.1 DUF916 and DUF3324 domain-containing protein [Bacillus cereus group sp. BfR-BA-01700]OJE46637.1 cell surface protein [Bacillus mobilis]HDR7242306.1 DUF916 and DUF3324 domain-containing protein [Bacillus mobilis]
MAKKIFTSLLLIAFFMVNTFSAYAAEMKFAVTAVIPENQIDKNQTYFDLKMQPGQKQTIQVQMKNDTNKEVVVESFANTAITNSNGITDYSTVEPPMDSTMKNPFSKIAKMPKETKVPANSAVTIDVNLEMPSESFDGVILGGLYFKEKEDEASKNKQEGVQIENKYAYAIGVVLRETDVEVKPDMKLNEVKPTQINGRNVVTANLQNVKPAMLKNLSVDAKVYKEKGKDVLFEEKKENLRMAPNSNFDYAISWENKAFDPGTYRVEITATDGDQKWEWKKNFSIEGKTADKLNDSAVEAKKDYTLYYIIGGVLLVVLLLVLVFFLGRRSNKEKNNEK